MGQQRKNLTTSQFFLSSACARICRSAIAALPLFIFPQFLAHTVHASATLSTAKNDPKSGAAQTPTGPVAGTVVTTTGSVSAIFNKKPRSLKPGDSIFQGESIATGTDGKTKILMADKTLIDLNSSGEFKVAEFKANNGNDREVDLQVAFGSLKTSVNKPITGKGKFQVRTKSATMGVRGTEFVVRAEKPNGTGQVPKTEVTVLQGRVDVAQGALGKAIGGANQKPVSLTAGAQISTSSSGALPTKPVMLSATQLGSISKASSVQDNTFVKSISIEVSKDGGGSGQNQNRSPASSSGASGASSSVAGEATKAVISQTLAVSMPAIVSQAPIGPTSVGNSGFIGTFGTASTLNNQPTQVRPGGIKTITVVITQ